MKMPKMMRTTCPLKAIHIIILKKNLSQNQKHSETMQCLFKGIVNVKAFACCLWCIIRYQQQIYSVTFHSPPMDFYINFCCFWVCPVQYNSVQYWRIHVFSRIRTMASLVLKVVLLLYYAPQKSNINLFCIAGGASSFFFKFTIHQVLFLPVSVAMLPS